MTGTSLKFQASLSLLISVFERKKKALNNHHRKESSTECQDSLREAMARHGLILPSHVIPGIIRRIPGVGKNPSNRSGFYLLFSDEQGAMFGDWSSDLREFWWAKDLSSLTPKERRDRARRAKHAQDLADQEKKWEQHQAAQKAQWLWAKASSSSPYNHPYVMRKNIKPYGTRRSFFYGKDVLVLPIIDFERNITSLQFIRDDGSKRFLKGGRKKGCLIPVQSLHHPQHTIICEGWATACTLAQHMPESRVVSSIDADNLTSVALGIAKKFPHSPIQIVADDDRDKDQNKGYREAEKAVLAVQEQTDVSVEWFIPNWPDEAPSHLTDVNDLMIWNKEEKSSIKSRVPP